MGDFYKESLMIMANTVLWEAPLGKLVVVAREDIRKGWPHQPEHEPQAMCVILLPPCCLRNIMKGDLLLTDCFH